MTVYYVLMALILGLAYPLCIRRPSAKKNIIYVCIVFAYMFVLSSLRYSIGNDYYHYRQYFYDMKIYDMSFSETMNSFGIEPGYVLLMKLVEAAGGEYLHLNIMTALLTLVPVGYVICRYSKMPWISCWLYLTITFFYNSMNFTRQSIAAAIVFFSFGFIKKKKHLAVFLMIIAGSMFHMSVLLMIPVYLISLIKPTAKSMGIIGACAVLVFIFSNQIIDFLLDNIFQSYAKYADSIYLTVGLTPKFLIIPTILAVIIISAYFLGMKEKEPDSAMLVNFIFYNFLIWLFIIKHFIIERFTLPIYIFTLLSLPEALEFYRGYKPADNKTPKNRKYLIGLKRLYPVLTCAVVVSTFIYNDFCAGQRVHGVFPYRSLIKPQSSITSEDLAERPREIYVNAYMLEFLYYVTKRDYTVVLCVKGDVGSELELPYRMYLKKLGFDTDFTSLDGKSYIGVVSGGKKVFERTGEELLTENMTLYDQKYSLTAVSGGTDYGDTASLTVNGREFLPNGNGLNFAVFDNELKRIVTAQCYDTSTYNYKYIHSDGFNGIEYTNGFKEDFQGSY